MPTYVLRPYTDEGDWANVGGSATPFSDDNDATYKVFNNAYQYGTVYFSMAGIPWGASIAIKSMAIRIRSQTTGGAVVSAVTAGTGKGRALISGGDGVTLFSTGVLKTDGVGARAIVFNQSDGDIVVSVHPVTAIGGGVTVRYHEFYLDIVAQYPPALTATLPSGTYTATSAPPFAYTYFSADGQPQVAYRYLIYTAAQYGASGFVPGSSAAAYDSGVIYSSSKVGNLHPMVNGTYRVYFAAAQLLNGALQWSLWSSSTSFTNYVVNITPPAAPTITPTVDSANARITLAVTGGGAANSVLDVYEIERSFDSGVTWETVRSDIEGGYVDNIGGARTWYDYETGNNQSAVYRARTITFDTVGNTLVGAYSSTSSAVAWASARSWLKIATRPDLNRVITIQELGSEEFPIPQGVFQGLDSGSAVVVSGVRRDLPDSEIGLYVETAAERTALRSILALGEPVLVQANSRVEDWYQVTKYLALATMKMSRAVRVAVEVMRTMNMRYTEVDRPDPTVYLLPTSLGVAVTADITTWGDIDDQFATFTALNAAFTTYEAIRQ